MFIQRAMFLDAWSTKRWQVWNNLGWRMKFLPLKYRWVMQENPGKAGMCWHSVYVKLKKMVCAQTNFYNDIGDDKEEDGFAVHISYIIHWYLLLKQGFSHVTEKFVLSNGADCYSGNYLAINISIVCL